MKLSWPTINRSFKAAVIETTALKLQLIAGQARPDWLQGKSVCAGWAKRLKWKEERGKHVRDGDSVETKTAAHG